MENKNLKTLEILMKYIREVDGTAGIASDDMLGMPNPASLTIEPITKKETTFTLEQLKAIIDSLPQPGGYIHIDDLTKAITNGGDTN